MGLRDARIGLFGNIANYPYQIGKTLRRMGMNVEVILAENEFVFSHPQWEEGDFEVSGVRTTRTGLTTSEVARAAGPDAWGPTPPWIRKIRGGLRHHLRPRNLMHSLESLGTAYPYRVLSLPREGEETRDLEMMATMTDYDVIVPQGFYVRFAPRGRRPYVVSCVGADITDIPFSGSPHSRRQTEGLRKASSVILGEARYRDSANRLGLTNTVYLPLMIDFENYPPVDRARVSSIRERFGEGPLILAPARMDFGFKGTHRVIEAFARFVSKFPRARLLQADWGIDADRVRELVRGFEIEENVVFLPTMAKRRLLTYYHAADAVVDNVEQGGYAAVGADAMALGKPLLVWSNPEAMLREMGSVPPVFDVNTVDEILAAFMAIGDGKGEEMGKRAKEWIRQNHSTDVLLPKFLGLLRKALEDAT